MALRPEISLGAGLATAAVVYGVFSNATPTIADIRSLESQNKDINAAERQATWTAAGIVGAISLIAKDPTIFIVGGAMVIALAWSHRHANAVDNVTGKATTYASMAQVTPPVTQAEEPQAYMAPTYDGSGF